MLNCESHRNRVNEKKIETVREKERERDCRCVVEMLLISNAIVIVVVPAATGTYLSHRDSR